MKNEDNDGKKDNPDQRRIVSAMHTFSTIVTVLNTCYNISLNTDKKQEVDDLYL